METIEEALEKYITRGNCNLCPNKYYNAGVVKCAVTEEIIGSGDEYCALCL